MWWMINLDWLLIGAVCMKLCVLWLQLSACLCWNFIHQPLISRKKKKKNWKVGVCDLWTSSCWFGEFGWDWFICWFFFLVLLCVLEDIDLLFFFCATRVIPSMSKWTNYHLQRLSSHMITTIWSIANLRRLWTTQRIWGRFFAVIALRIQYLRWASVASSFF